MTTSKAVLFSLCFLSVGIFGCATSNTSTPAAPAVLAEAPLLPDIPETRRENHDETIHGYAVSDPYRWLEDEKKANAWIEAQNFRTREYLALQDRPNLEQDIERFFKVGYVGSPQRIGDKVFYEKISHPPGKVMNQAALYVLENGEERKLVDPDALDPSGKTTIDWYIASPKGRYVAYGLSLDGSENSTLYLLDLTTGKTLADRLPETRHCSVAWLKDETGFYYTRYPKGERYHRHVYFHLLGDDISKDAAVFGEKRKKTDWPSLDISEDGRFLFVMVFTTSTSNDFYMLDRKTGRWQTIAENLDGTFHGAFFHENQLFMTTTYDAPKGRVIRLSPKKPAPKHWKTVIPEGEHTLAGVANTKSTLVAYTIERAVTRLRLYGFDGSEQGEIPLPTLGSVESLDVDVKDDIVVFSFASFMHPPTLYSVAIGEKPKKIAEVWTPDDLDLDRFIVKQVMYPSYDGTQVPMFIIHRKDLELTGSTPTLLNGYGGFDISMTPYFSRNTLFWIERGGVYAVANLRGGGEFGRAWHEAGMREKKYQVFQDFQYAMRYLHRENYCSPKTLAIIGGSNGGLLVGAMLTQAPYLFEAGVGDVGLYDMVRYHLFPPGEIWSTEYGMSKNANQTGYLWAYSPYHQTIRGAHYPAALIETAESDTRVHWMHSAKFAAAMQYANASDNPILFLLRRKAGHGQGKSWSESVKEYADKYRFIMSRIGDPSQP